MKTHVIIVEEGKAVDSIIEGRQISKENWRIREQVNGAKWILKDRGIPYIYQKYEGFVPRDEAIKNAEIAGEFKFKKRPLRAFVFYEPDYEEDPPLDFEIGEYIITAIPLIAMFILPKVLR